MVRLNQTNKHTLHNIFLMTLMALFSVISISIIAIGVGQYRTLTSRMTKNMEIRAASAYLVDTFKQHDVAGAISITELEGIPALSFSENEKQTLLLYAYDGYLRELVVSENGHTNACDGKKICKMTELLITECTNSIYCLTVTDSYGNTTPFYISQHAD